jgi:plastocyanin
MVKRVATMVAGSMVVAILALAPAGIAAAGGGCFHGTPPSVGEGTEVDLVDNCFEATVLRVDPGAQVTWTNRDDYEHTVTGVGGQWGTVDAVAPGERVAFSFDNDGVYVYSCLLHPGMVGAVVVGSGQGDGTLQPVSAIVPGSGGGGTTSTGAADSSSGGMTTGIVGGVVGILLGLGIAGVLIAKRRVPRAA